MRTLAPDDCVALLSRLSRFADARRPGFVGLNSSAQTEGRLATVSHAHTIAHVLFLCSHAASQYLRHAPGGSVRAGRGS